MNCRPGHEHRHMRGQRQDGSRHDVGVMMLYWPLALSDRSPTRTLKRSATPLRAAFSPAVRTHMGSMSTPSAESAPNFRRGNGRMPEPGADVEHALPAPDKAVQRLEAERGRLMRAGAKGHAGP